MVGGGGCTYDYSVSLSPNLWIMTFNLDLDLDLGLTIFDLDLYSDLDYGDLKVYGWWVGGPMIITSA